VKKGTPLKFVDDKQKSIKFELGVHNALEYLKKCPNSEHYKTFVTVLNDNIKLFKRVKELEDGNTSTKAGE